VNIQAVNGNTALIEACLKGSVSLAKLLISVGAEISTRAKDGTTCLMVFASLNSI
jgi:ankyrin repeat protein